VKRREEILSAARELVERDGFEALTMRALAARVGMQAPSLYKHLPSKRELERNLVLVALEELGAALSAAAAGEDEPLEAAAAAYRRFALERPHLYRLLTERPVEADGFELVAASPLLKALGSVRRARAAWAFFHGMVQLELAGRFEAGADLDAAWQAGLAAFSRASGS
jgi:AcrR family transcriptional regulator